MSSLENETCTTCRADAPRVTAEKRDTLGQRLPEWTLVTRNGETQLERVFSFTNFAQALAFTNKVGDLAEAEGHHPLLITEWGRVTVYWWTHKIGGLHRNDYIMAARTDAAFAQQ